MHAGNYATAAAEASNQQLFYLAVVVRAFAERMCTDTSTRCTRGKSSDYLVFGLRLVISTA